MYHTLKILLHFCKVNPDPLRAALYNTLVLCNISHSDSLTQGQIVVERLGRVGDVGAVLRVQHMQVLEKVGKQLARFGIGRMHRVEVSKYVDELHTRVLLEHTPLLVSVQHKMHEFLQDAEANKQAGVVRLRRVRGLTKTRVEDHEYLLPQSFTFVSPDGAPI